MPGRFSAGLLLLVRAWLRPIAFGVTGAIRDPEGRILLVRQTYASGWRLPGGGIDHGEAPDAALMRELQEEVGLMHGRAQLFGLYGGKRWWLDHVVARYVVDGGEIRFTPNREVAAVLWALPQSPPEGTAPATRRRLAELAGGAQQDGMW